MKEEEELEAPAADIAGERAADAFGVLGSETRLAILFALWEHHDPGADENVASFTELWNEVGIRDSGQFNYHLEKLTGRFVDASEEGYSLRESGHNIIRAIVSGVGLEEPTLDASGVDLSCPVCGGTSVDARYEDRAIVAACPDCGSSDETEERENRIMKTRFPPSGVLNRSVDEALFANDIQNTADWLCYLSGTCPTCAGVVEGRFEICDEHEVRDGRPCAACDSIHDLKTRMVCTACKESFTVSGGRICSAHPQGMAFLAEHGIPFGMAPESPPDMAQLERIRETIEYDHSIRSESPIRVEMSISHESGDSISFVFDENVRILGIERASGD